MRKGQRSPMCWRRRNARYAQLPLGNFRKLRNSCARVNEAPCAGVEGMLDLPNCRRYSSVCFVLYFIAAANFYVSFWLDKLLFVKLCKEPKPYSAMWGKQATQLIPLAVAFHAAMSVWMLSNGEIFSSDVNSQISDIAAQGGAGSKSGLLHDVIVKITYKQTVPLFALFCGIIGLYIVWLVLGRLHEIYDVLRLFCVGDAEVKNRIEVLQFIRDEGVVETLSGLVYAGKMKGLTTYSILQNPDYKESFGITWAFAFKHQRLKSLYNFKTNELTRAGGAAADEEEEDMDKALAQRHRFMKKQAEQAKRAVQLQHMQNTRGGGLSNPRTDNRGTAASHVVNSAHTPSPEPLSNPRHNYALARAGSELLKQQLMEGDEDHDDDDGKDDDGDDSGEDVVDDFNV